MYDHSNVHHAMTDNAVRYESDECEREEWADPLVGGSAENNRQDEIGSDSASSANRESERKVKKLYPSLSARARPFREKDDERDEPGEQKVHRKQRVQCAGLSYRSGYCY